MWLFFSFRFDLLKRKNVIANNKEQYHGNDQRLNYWWLCCWASSDGWKAQSRGEETEHGRLGEVFSSSFAWQSEAAIWLRALLSNSLGRKICFSRCVSNFNICILIWEWDAEKLWKNCRLWGKGEDWPYGKSVQLFHAALFVSPGFCILCRIVVELNSSIVDDFYVSAVWELSVRALNVLLLPANKRGEPVGAVCCSAINFVVSWRKQRLL